MYDKTHWYKTVLEKVPHGQEGTFNFAKEDAIAMMELLLKNGYAVCVTGGHIGEDWRIDYVYAGDTENLDYADYQNVAFTSTDYMDEYYEAMCHENEEDCNEMESET